MSYGNVAVVIEEKNNKIHDLSLELLSKAQDLAAELDTKVSAYLLTAKDQGLSNTLFEYGADYVYLIENKELENFRTLPYQKSLVELVEKDNPYIVLFGATRIGRDIAPRVASKMKSGLTADCTDLKIADYEDKKTGKIYKNLLNQIRPAFGGNIVATIINPERHPQMATVREGVMKLKDPQKGRTGKLIKIDMGFDAIETAVKLIKKEEKKNTINLKKSTILVAGGMGVGSKENFNTLFDLANLIGGDVGASRAAVDQGWVEKERQVGQTGVTVRPKLYVACGISGSIQHKAGMDDSLKIIAINSDPNAPIFDFAHIKIVGDLNTVLPKMIEAYKNLDVR